MGEKRRGGAQRSGRCEIGVIDLQCDARSVFWTENIAQLIYVYYMMGGGFVVAGKPIETATMTMVMEFGLVVRKWLFGGLVIVWSDSN